MAAGPRLVPVPGADRSIPQGATLLGPADPSAIIRVLVRIRPRAALPPPSAGPRDYPSREQFAAAHGADEADLQKVETFALAHNLSVIDRCQARRSVWLEGTLDAFQTAFHVTLDRYRLADGRVFRGRVGPILIPEDLHLTIVGVFGLDDRPQARPFFRLRPPGTAPFVQGSLAQFTPPQIASLYHFPAGFDGSGQTIALIELGGGYSTSDLQTYFSQLGIPSPTVVSVPVDSASNSPTGFANGPDGEVGLDIEVAGSIALGAKIVVYFAPNTDSGFLDAVTQAVHDTVNRPSVISISWGGPESNWTGQAMSQFDQAFQDAASLGVTVCVAAGDNGSSDGQTDGLAHVDFPASSPHVLACGGTELTATASQIISEVVWNDPGGGATGGGVSQQFGLPGYQIGLGVPPSVNPGGQVGRGVPDVAGNADPNTGYQILVDGQPGVAGGTSAVAPLYAALVAILNQALGKPVGFLNPTIYQANARAAFRDITNGNNGAYTAGPGWDACTGLGVANGRKLLKSLGG